MISFVADSISSVMDKLSFVFKKYFFVSVIICAAALFTSIQTNAHNSFRKESFSCIQSNIHESIGDCGYVHIYATNDAQQENYNNICKAYHLNTINLLQKNIFLSIKISSNTCFVFVDTTHFPKNTQKRNVLFRTFLI
ncbi:MAG: hypothetical protein ABI199_05825 [Bacteroidia bacterium]